LDEQTRNEIGMLISKLEHMTRQKEQMKEDKKLIKQLTDSINIYLEEKPLYTKLTILFAGLAIGIFFGTLF
jgi:hypothetical protein